jgi:hypothetical protein
MDSAIFLNWCLENSLAFLNVYVCGRFSRSRLYCPHVRVTTFKSFNPVLHDREVPSVLEVFYSACLHKKMTCVGTDSVQEC